MIESIVQHVDKAIGAVTPWLVGLAAGFFVLWLIVLCCQIKPFAKEFKRFLSLTAWHKFAFICFVAFCALWGGSKESGLLPSGLIDGISLTMTRAVDTVQLRSLPEDVSTNALAMTGFEIDPTNRTAFFAMRWATNLFDYTDSRNLYLFSSTNLLERKWTPLCTILLPTETNACSFAVTQNDVVPSMRHWFADTFGGIGFYRFGADFDADGDGIADDVETLWTLTDPAKPDTDGDGLSDGQELSSQVNTNPLAFDTDGDGVGDGDEVAAGSNPRREDSDRDGLSDAREIGAMNALAGSNFMWFDMSGGTDLLADYSTVNGGSWKIPLAAESVVNDVCYTNLRVCVDGTVHLLCPTNETGWYASFYGNLSNSQWSASHLTVALYGADLYARTADWGSRILYGSLVSDGRSFDVVEYRNLGLYDRRDTNELITCQLIVPHDETNTVYVSYLCASNTFREVSLAAGIQCGGLPSRKSGERYYNLSWPITADFPQDGLTIKYSIGTCTDPTRTDTDGDGLTDPEESLTYHTDPLVVDTDGDGLSDRVEVSMGTKPRSADTDTDGMPDGWEAYYGLKLLIDDSSLDADNDGLSNRVEYEAGTNPGEPDTDGDGIGDRDEFGWWEYADGLPFFNASSGTNLLQSSQNYYGNCFVVSLPFAFNCAGYLHTNATVCLDGVVGLMSDRATSSFSVSASNDDISSASLSSYHTAVAAYWDDLYAKANGGAQIRVADITVDGKRYAVIEYASIRLYSQRDNASATGTFQVVIPQSETNTVYVRYVNMSDAFNGGSASIGAQLPRREKSFAVAFNEDGSVTNNMTIAYHFGTGTNPLVVDTDGDGLEDGVEIAIGTSSRYTDTDGDGLSDYWEHQQNLDPLSSSGDDGADGDPDGDRLTNARELAYGTDPSLSDTDADGLPDGVETGYIFATNAVPWMTFNESDDITAALSSANRRCVNLPTPVAMVMQGETVTNLTISANGIIFFNRAGYANPGDSTSGESFRYEVDDETFVIAPYLEYTYFRTDIPMYETAVKVGTSTCNGEGYLIVEFDNMFRNTSTWQTNAISFQVSVPTNRPTCAYVRYKDLSGQYMTGDYASIGMQTFDSRWLHSYCDDAAGKVWEGLCLEFLFGSNSDPLVSDTDGDGLPDGWELSTGTSPVKVDTDGDGLPDNWEVQNGLDPLSPLGDDGESGDPDGDGVDNYAEYELGTNPQLADTDNDGLPDGREAVCVSFANPLPWFEVSVLTNMTEALTNSYCNCISIDLPSPVMIQREIVTNITIDADCVVYFNRAGYENPAYSRGMRDLDSDSVDTNCFTVAPYWSWLSISNEADPSSVKFGTATDGDDGYYVLECLHLYKDVNSYETNSISFQMSFPTGRVDKIKVRYADIVGDEMDGDNASIGIQSFGARERVSYCYFDRDKVYDGMGLTFVIGSGSDPLVEDTDGDGISDGVEVNTYGSDPMSTDTDADGLTDAREAVLGTALDNPDSDGDGLLDGWEVDNSFNPLSQQGSGESGIDTDGDGLTNLQEQTAGSDPRNADSDDDGLSDPDEVAAGTNPTLADTDHDGLNDGEEDSLGTNPLQPDSDSDGMNDGWEYRYGFDPTVGNATDDDPDNDKGSDPDGDGLTNGQECSFGTDPLDSDSDGDGVGDGAEVGQNSDPTDPDDGGQPNSRVAVPFTFGDPSSSHSEKYTLEVTPVSGVGETPSSFSWLNENYGQCETKTAMLKPGWKYEVRLYHSGTNGSGDGYPDYDYELDFSGNDTTEGVIKDDPDGLFGTDYTSDSFAGEGKVAYVYALAPLGLVPDYDRDGAITSDDVGKAAQKKKLRFWINDDEDDDSTDGKYAESPSVDIPGARAGWFEFDRRDPDWNDTNVNGYRDLIDFTPVYLDVSTIQMLPEKIRNNLTFKLSHAAGAVNVVWSGLSKSSAGLFQKGNVGVCGRNLDEASYEAEAERVGTDGVAVPDALATQMKNSSTDKGVVFIEGREATSAPLKLDIYYNGQKVVSGELPLQLSSVEDMYWFYSIRGSESNLNTTIPDGNSPENSMENPSDVDIFFTHGFNVDAKAARGWGSEVFKRLWQSGSNVRFHMVTWAGDYRFGEDLNPLEKMNGFFYHRDVQYALNSANAYKRLVECVQASKAKRVLMAQSLGNMVTCEAIRLGLDAEKYYMFNAAVASEAIVSTLQNADSSIRQKFVPPDWRSYNSLSWAANWYRLFPNDDRAHIGWPGYFTSALSGISEVCNYYSSGDPVLVSNADIPSALTKTLYVQWPVSFSWSWPFVRFQSFEFQATFERFAWQKQEVLKGVDPYLATLEGGWGFHSWCVDLPNGENEWRTFTYQEAQEMVTNGSIVTNAVFERSVSAMFSQTIPLADRNRILAYNVPAISESTGSVPTFEHQSKSVNLNSSAYKNGWGRSGNPYNDQWLHSDMKDMAYYYVYRLYDELVQKIQGGPQ